MYLDVDILVVWGKIQTSIFAALELLEVICLYVTN